MKKIKYSAERLWLNPNAIFVCFLVPPIQPTNRFFWRISRSEILSKSQNIKGPSRVWQNIKGQILRVHNHDLQLCTHSPDPHPPIHFKPKIHPQIARFQPPKRENRSTARHADLNCRWISWFSLFSMHVCMYGRTLFTTKNPAMGWPSSSSEMRQGGPAIHQ